VVCRVRRWGVGSPDWRRRCSGAPGRPGWRGTRGCASGAPGQSALLGLLSPTSRINCFGEIQSIRPYTSRRLGGSVKKVGPFWSVRVACITGRLPWNMKTPWCGSGLGPTPYTTGWSVQGNTLSPHTAVANGWCTRCTVRGQVAEERPTVHKIQVPGNPA